MGKLSDDRGMMGRIIRTAEGILRRIYGMNTKKRVNRGVNRGLFPLHCNCRCLPIYIDEIIDEIEMDMRKKASGKYVGIMEFIKKIKWRLIFFLRQS